MIPTDDVLNCVHQVSRLIKTEPNVMKLLSSDHYLGELDNLIHADTQQQKFSLDLTVSEIHQITNAGSLDFGGSEFKAASTREIKAQKTDPADKYGWWQLEDGIFKAVCNESFNFKQSKLVMISPHEHALQAGLIVNASVRNVDSGMQPISLLIQTPDTGCNIKENARFATLHIFSE
jgi:hypothetical protein